MTIKGPFSGKGEYEKVTAGVFSPEWFNIAKLSPTCYQIFIYPTREKARIAKRSMTKYL